MKITLFKRVCICILLAAAGTALANLPGGGTGTGSNVTLADNGSTVTIGNGIISILCTKSGGSIDQINYTFNNTGSSQTLNLLSGNPNGGQLYWESGNNQGLTFTYSIVANPASNGGNYAEIAVTTLSESNSVLEVHYSLSRGSTGFYVTAIWLHRSIDGAWSLGECRDNIYAGSIFNWMSVDATRNRLMDVSSSSLRIGVQGAPGEVSLWTNGIYAGQYEDKYKYSADFGDQRVWGWSSVGTGGKNVGLWNVSASAEYYNGGPLKRELMSHLGTTILNMVNGGHYGGGSDGSFAAGEVWTKVCGPYFIYCNNVTNTLTGTNAPAQALYTDALAQAAAEATAWPYNWFTNANYAPASNRGTVSGQLIINDTNNPNASVSNLWVGLIQQPATTAGVYDFQGWAKPYQFWVKTGSNGTFTLHNVIAGTNYTLYAFGPGAAGTFQSQAQTGGSAPNTLDIPASPFSVTVTAGATNNLGTKTWRPTRIGPTVFEIGYPDRTGRKFRHGDDWWVGDIGPSNTAPSPVWGKHLEFPFDFPNGVSYTVGQSRWTTDWNYVQPAVINGAGAFGGSASTINFNLASAPSGNASIYIALASDYQGPLRVIVNGTDIASGTTGYFPAYNSSGNQSDATIREAIHGLYSDNRITFSAGLLQTGPNTITINMRKGDDSSGLGSGWMNHAMYDYVRLELTGYVPPPPASAIAYAGNNCNLVCWPVTPGASSYKIWRSTTSGSGYGLLTNGVVGPVCGSGWNNATWLDTTVANGSTYYYVVQSVNSAGSSLNSTQSPGAIPSGLISSSAPATPAGVTIVSSSHQSATINWSGSSGANFYTVYRATLYNNGGGASNVLGTVVLANNVTGATYTDNSPTDGSIYGYYVTATSAGGMSGNSAMAVTVPRPVPPANATTATSQTAATTNNIKIKWTSVSGAVGYEVSRATSATGPFTFLQPVTETNYTDGSLDTGVSYYYQVAAMNAGGVSTNATLPAYTIGAPIGLITIPANAQIVVDWAAAPGATNYVVQRSTTDGGPYTTIVATTNSVYLNASLQNGTTYYYVVYANTPFGPSPTSAQVAATPSTNVQIMATASMPGTTVASATGPTLATSTSFDLNGGNAVALIVTSECGSSTPAVSATFAGQSMIPGVVTNQANQWAGIFYLINPAATGGQFVITSTNSSTTGLAYSAMALGNIGDVASLAGAANTLTSGTTSLTYTTATNAGYVLAAAINNGYSSTYPAPAYNPGNNANQTLYGPALFPGGSSGHLHLYGDVPTAGTYTDIYTNMNNTSQRNAYVTLVFDANVLAAPINTNPPVILASYAGGMLTLAWPTNPGWTLQQQTNSLSKGLGSNWVDVLGSPGITTTNIPVDPASPAVFYRLKL